VWSEFTPGYFFWGWGGVFILVGIDMYYEKI